MAFMSCAWRRNSASDIGANDDFCGLQSNVTADLTGGTYYVTIDGFGGATGDGVDLNKAQLPAALLDVVQAIAECLLFECVQAFHQPARVDLTVDIVQAV